ncbi:DUF983 domain-containing protein [bacterium SCSIO 12643]|nr:DUF983 domain-containing protein [bacterium SCSIO 12643]
MKSIIKGKCPRCRKSDIFCSTNPYNFKKLFLMPEHCDSCGLKFNMEPGFFYGAMYVGYGLSVAYLTAVYVAMEVLLDDFAVGLYFILGIGSLIVFTPFIFRLSRSIWLTMFVKYDKDAEAKWAKELNGEKRENPCINV